MAKKNTSQKFTKIDKDAIIALRKVVQAHLEPLIKGIGLEVKVGAGMYGESTGSLKLEFTLPAVGGIPVTYRENCKDYELTLEDFGKPFTYKGEQCKIIGLKPNARTFPIEVVRIESGETSVFSAFLIQEALGKNAPKRERAITELKEIATKHPEVPLTEQLYYQKCKGFGYRSMELFGSFEKFVKAAGLEARLPKAQAAGV